MIIKKRDSLNDVSISIILLIGGINYSYQSYLVLDNTVLLESSEN